MKSPVGADRAGGRERRYLLGQLSEEERTELEIEYLAAGDRVEQVTAVEDELIEEYLDGELGADDRTSFEREYLSAPSRLKRLDTVRRLRVAASATPALSADRSVAPRWGWPLAAAAVIVLAMGLTLWLRQPGADREARVPPQPVTPPSRPSPSTPDDKGIARQSPSPRLLAVSLSPIVTRSNAETEAIVVPKDVDALALTLNGQTAVTRPRVEIAAVGGQRVWQGTASVGIAPGTAATVEVPAAALPADDYIVTMFTATSSGAEAEAYRYVLRVRVR